MIKGTQRIACPNKTLPENSCKHTLRSPALTTSLPGSVETTVPAPTQPITRLYYSATMTAWETSKRNMNKGSSPCSRYNDLMI